MKDLNLTIKERNEMCAEIIGWFKEEGHNDSYFEYNYDNNGNIISKVVAYSLYKDTNNELPFYKDLNYTYKLLEKVKTIKKIDRFEISEKSFFATIFKVNNGKYDFESIYYVIGENCGDWREGFYLFLSDILIHSDNKITNKKK